MPNKYGLIKKEIQPEHWILGSNSQLPQEIIQPDHNWLPFLFKDDLQARLGYEVYDCATMGTKHAFYSLAKKKFDFNDEYSARWVAKKTGTDKLHGNDPHAVAEFIRTNGMVEEYEWPYQGSSYDDFYRDTPPPLDNSAKTFISHYEVGHEWIPTDPQNLMYSLTIGPVCISVQAWTDRGDGIMKAGDGMNDNHWVQLYDYVENEYYCVFDTYDLTHKKVEWKHRPERAKRYHLELAPQSISLLDTLKKNLQAILIYLKNVATQQRNEPLDPPAPIIPQPTAPQPPAPLPAPKPKLLIPFCSAIRDYEGAPGDRNYRNNNPGNLRYSGQPGTTGKDADGFAIFTTYQAGWNCLVTMVENAASGKSEVYKPTMTIKDFFHVYAPSSDNNNPDAYALFVAKRLAVDAATYQISNLV